MNNARPQRTLAILFWNLGIGGVQTKIVDLANELGTKDSAGAVHIILRDAPPFRLDGHIRADRAIIHYRPHVFSRSAHVPFTIYSVYTLMRLSPDVILAFLDHASFLAIIAAKLIFWKKVRVVLNEDTYPSGHTVSPAKRMLVRLLYPAATSILTPTRASKDNLSHAFGVPAALISVRPNWTLHTRNPIAEKARYDLLYVGRFDTQKNLFALLRAVRLLRRKRKRITLCMVGEGILEKKLRAFIRRNDLQRNVTIHPSSHDVFRHMETSRVFVMCSHFEGMPLAMLEAMAHGMAVVSLEYPGLSEYVQHGRTGLIAHSETEFVRLLEDAVTSRDLRMKLARSARAAVAARYGRNAMKRFIESSFGVAR